ncbi:flagellar biosynthesis anti-sigma factor FlgM [Spongiibacter marinus]|jgi:negative regulator of flagellin synthesis FlgM|uniref:flagellar biosynthesis anti-sigma factor FlgM n=1 Tax=Spongiibacter marinus TaxID=354246 RepID=UPI003565659C
MVDRINGGPLGQPRRLDSNPSSNATNAADTGATSPLESATASAADSSLVDRARTAIAGSDGIDRQKVEAIKTAIRNGEFTVDSEQVAKAFVDLERLTDPSA